MLLQVLLFSEQRAAFSRYYLLKNVGDTALSTLLMLKAASLLRTRQIMLDNAQDATCIRLLSLFTTIPY